MKKTNLLGLPEQATELGQEHRQCQLIGVAIALAVLKVPDWSVSGGVATVDSEQITADFSHAEKTQAKSKSA